MSVIEYNNLVFNTIQRLRELNVGEQLRFMCRGKMAPRDEQNLDFFLMFEELEQNGFLGPDKLDVLKGILKGLKEWPLFGSVKAFEIKRKEYSGLLERIILVLDELDCLEELFAIYSDRIPEEKHGSIQDIRSLFKELEDNDSLGFDQLEVLKEMLTRKGKTDLLQEVEEFEERKNQEDEFEWRKGKSSFRLLSVSCGFTFRFINFLKSIMAKFAAMPAYSSKCTELNVSRFNVFLQHKQLRLRRPLAVI